MSTIKRNILANIIWLTLILIALDISAQQDTAITFKPFILNYQFQDDKRLELPIPHTIFQDDLLILTDEGYSIDEVMDKELWRLKSYKNSHKGYNRLDTFWLGCTFINGRKESESYLLFLQNWTHAEIYISDKEGGYKILNPGLTIDNKEKSIKDPHNYFKLSLAENDTVQAYFQVYSQYPNVTLPVKQEFFIANVDENAFSQLKQKKSQFFPLQGYFLAHVMYGLIIFILLREKVVLYFFILSFANLISDMCMSPSETLFLFFPQLKPWNIVLSNFFVWLILVGAIGFVWEYTGLETKYRKLKKASNWVLIIFLAYLIPLTISLMYYDQTWHFLFNSATLPTNILGNIELFRSIICGLGFSFVLLIPAIAIYKRVRHAGYLLISVFFPAFSSVIFQIISISNVLGGHHSIYQSVFQGNEAMQIYPFIQFGVFFFVSFLAILIGLKAKEIITGRQLAMQKQIATEKRAAKQMEEVFSAANRFVPHEFIKTLGHEKITEVNLGEYVQKYVTIMFLDIRGYTTLAESMSARDNFEFIKSFNSRVSPIIHAHGGFINQYLGDGIMALFPKKPLDALNAARAIQNAMVMYNDERLSKGRSHIQIGIGFHFGELSIGIIGDEQRFDMAIISDVVNTAARIESLTKFYGSDILMSSEAYNVILKNILDQKLPDSTYHFRFLGRVKVKGKAKDVGIFECIHSDSADLLSKRINAQPIFEEGLRKYYNKQFNEAQYQFQKVLEHLPEDRISKIYLERASNYIETGVPEYWDGVETMDSK